MAKLWAKKERNKFYLPGEEIKVNRNFAFSGFDLEKDPLSACKNRMLLAVFGFILIYVIIAVRTLGICISGFSPDDGNGEKELPQLKIENPITRADVTDRNGTIIATSLPTANLFAHPRKVRDKEKVAAKLSEYIPDMLYEEILEQLEKNSNFIYIKRNLSLAQRYQIYALGIQGLGFEDVEKEFIRKRTFSPTFWAKPTLTTSAFPGWKTAGRPPDQFRRAAAADDRFRRTGHDQGKARRRRKKI